MGWWFDHVTLWGVWLYSFGLAICSLAFLVDYLKYQRINFAIIGVINGEQKNTERVSIRMYIETSTKIFWYHPKRNQASPSSQNKLIRTHSFTPHTQRQHIRRFRAIADKVLLPNLPLLIVYYLLGVMMSKPTKCWSLFQRMLVECVVLHCCHKFRTKEGRNRRWSIHCQVFRDTLFFLECLSAR